MLILQILLSDLILCDDGGKSPLHGCILCFIIFFVDGGEGDEDGERIGMGALHNNNIKMFNI